MTDFNSQVDGTNGSATQSNEPKMPKRSRSFDESTKSSRLRRKSLDSPASSEAMKAIVRVNALEAKVRMSIMYLQDSVLCFLFKKYSTKQCVRQNFTSSIPNVDTGMNAVDSKRRWWTK